MITIYTDGSSLGNPGPGGWGALILKNDALRIKSDVKLSGWEEWTTNNRMEILAVISSLQRLVDAWYAHEQITIHMDSMYVHDGIEKYLASWIARGRRLANKRPVMNKDLWMQMHQLLSQFPSISWRWVKAHATSKYNNAVDLLARRAAMKIQASLPEGYTPPIKEDPNQQKPLFR